MKRILLTGGCGFVGHHVVEHFLRNTDWGIVILDRLDTSGTLNRLVDIDCWEKEKHRVQFYFHDLKSPLNGFAKKFIGDVQYIFHLAASTHVDRSIEDPLLFAQDNVVGTVNLLNFAKEMNGLEKFFNFSTDEVFGPAPEGYAFEETDMHNPKNPYAASKSGQEAFGIAFHNTYKLPIITTHTMNVFGERQHPEKFIPICIRKILLGEIVPIHSDATKTKSGSRFWIHARNAASAILFLVEKGIPGQTYNIVGEKEVSNLEIAQFVAKILGKELKYEMVDFHSSRPGHDLRYALDGTKMRDLGWKLPMNFEESLEKTVQWSLQNNKWVNI